MYIKPSEAIEYGKQAGIAQSQWDNARARHWTNVFNKLLLIADNKQELQMLFDRAYREQTQ